VKPGPATWQLQLPSCQCCWPGLGSGRVLVALAPSPLSSSVKGVRRIEEGAAGAGAGATACHQQSTM